MRSYSLDPTALESLQSDARCREVERWLKQARGRTAPDEALPELEERLRLTGDTAALIELPLGRVELAEDSAQRARLLAEVARLFERELEDPARAFTVLLVAHAEADRAATRDELYRL